MNKYQKLNNFFNLDQVYLLLCGLIIFGDFVIPGVKYPWD